MQNDSVTGLWNELQQALGGIGAPAIGLRPPAKEEEIASFEGRLGCRLPEDFRASLLTYDGQTHPQGLGLLPAGGRLVSLEEIVEEWEEETEDMEFNQEEPPGSSADIVRMVRYHNKRIPIGGTEHWDGDTTYLDLIPGPAGTVGQVISLKSGKFVVIGSSWSDFLVRLAALVRSGTLQVVQSDSGPCLDLAEKRTPWERWDALLTPKDL